MDCSDIRNALMATTTPAGEAVDAHCRTCQACEALLADNSALGSALCGPDEVTDAASLDSMLADVKGSIVGERGGTAWLRALPTRWRQTLAAALVVAVAAVFALFSPRGDLDTYPLLAWVAVLGATAAVLLLAVYYSLLPLHRGAPRRWVVPLLVVLALLVPACSALVPGLAGLHGHDDGKLLAGIVGCMAVGSVLGMPILLMTWALDRGAHGCLGRALLAACGAGLMGNIVLQIHCQCVRPLHVLAGHAVLVVLFVGAYGVVRRLRRT